LDEKKDKLAGFPAKLHLERDQQNAGWQTHNIFPKDDNSPGFGRFPDRLH
jgi:hypothetical protein